MLEEIELFVTIEELHYFSVCKTSKAPADLEMLILMINSDLAVTDLKRSDCSWN